MLEASLLAAIGFLLLAAATHRFRREAGVVRAGERAALRWAGAGLLVASAACCGSPLSGEWCVRFLAAASIGGVTVVLALSLASAAVLAPVRRLTAIRR